jgi:hypothetical protein
VGALALGWLTPAGVAGAQAPFVLNGIAVSVLEAPAGREPLRFGRAFAVTAEGGVLLQAGGNVYDHGSRSLLFGTELPALRDFAVASSGVLVAAVGSQIGVDSAGAFEALAQLPARELRVAANGTGLVLAANGDSVGALYYYDGSADPLKLFATPGRITALAAMRDLVLWAMDDMLLAFRPSTLAQVLFVTPDSTTIESIAVDSASQYVYFTAGHGVYALKAGIADLVAQDVGRVVRVASGVLYVWDPDVGRVVVLEGIERVLAASADRPRH